MQGTGQALGGFVLVLLLIPVALWALKRSGLAQRMGLAQTQAAGQMQVLRTVAQTSLGPGQRVVTVEVNAGGQRQWLVLGVTANQINTLSQMSVPNTPAPSEVLK